MKSLAEIYTETLYSTRFRVRNVETLQDLFIVDIPQYLQGRPVFLSCLKLDERTFIRYQLGATEKKFILLSTREECEYWKGLSSQQAAFKAKFFYHHEAKNSGRDLSGDGEGVLFSD